MPMRIDGLVFAGVGTADNAGVADFFAEVLGCEVEVSGDVHRVLFPNGTSVALVPPHYVEPPSDTLLGFLVDDLDRATEELSVRGVRPDGDLAAGFGFRYRHFRAPDGRRFELLERRA